MKKEFAVISITETGQIVCDRVVARSPINAFWETTRIRTEDVEFVFAMPWNAYLIMQKRGQSDYPGESLVSRSTVISQPEVFNAKSRG